MEFSTKYKREVDEGEDISPESKTEKVGYIPAQQQIERLILSGVRLNEYRKENYDFASVDDIDDSVVVPSRRLDFDPADATQLAAAAESRLQAQAAQIAAEKIAADAANEKKNLISEQSIPNTPADTRNT